MSAVTTTPPTPMTGPAPRLLTAADVAVFPRSLPSGDVKYELHDGRLVVMSPPGYRHARVGVQFAAAFHTFGEAAGHGEACD